MGQGDDEPVSEYGGGVEKSGVSAEGCGGREEIFVRQKGEGVGYGENSCRHKFDEADSDESMETNVKPLVFALRA